MSRRRFTSISDNQIPQNPIDNILDQILSPPGTGPGIVPTKLATTAQILAGAVTINQVREKLGADPATPAWRQSLSGQSRIYQAAVTAVAVRMLGRSSRLAQAAALPKDAVDNLLRFDTALGSLHQATWPLVCYGAQRTQGSDAACAGHIAHIDSAAAAPEAVGLRVALGVTEGVDQRQQRSQKTKTATKKRKTVAAGNAIAGQQGQVAAARALHRLATDAAAGVLPPSQAPAGGQKPAGSARTLPAAGTAALSGNAGHKAAAQGKPQGKRKPTTGSLSKAVAAAGRTGQKRTPAKPAPSGKKAAKKGKRA